MDPLTKSYPMLTTYQFASNSPSSAIDLDGLEAWIVITEKYGESDPINIMVFVNDFRFMGGVYEVHKDYDMDNVQVGLSGILKAIQVVQNNFLIMAIIQEKITNLSKRRSSGLRFYMVKLALI